MMLVSIYTDQSNYRTTRQMDTPGTLRTRIYHCTTLEQYYGYWKDKFCDETIFSGLCHLNEQTRKTTIRAKKHQKNFGGP
jgi:hypothetical protein